MIYERRYRIGVISKDEVVNHTKVSNEAFLKALKERLPDKTIIISQEDDMGTASLNILLYNAEFKRVKLGAEVEKFIIKLGKSKEIASNIIQIPH